MCNCACTTEDGCVRHGFNSRIGIDEQFQNWNCLFINNGIGIDKIGIEVCYKRILNPQISLPFNSLIQKYFFHDNPTRSRYAEYLLQAVIGVGKKSDWNWPNGIDWNWPQVELELAPSLSDVCQFNFKNE